jgi:hypothetical protein
MSMLSNVEGRVRHTRLPTGKPLLPVLECIVNSIHATNLTPKSKAKIEIEIVRDQRQRELLEERTELPIVGFVVRDNGIGFTDENYDSFSVADSDFKRSLGAKGVGRFLWLKAFDEVRIVSFYQVGAQRFRRAFTFRATKEGIHDHQVGPVENGATGTEVTLLNFGEPFQRTCAKRSETIAAKIVTHLLIYFYRQKIPEITLIDANSGSISLGTVYKEQIASKIDSSTFHIKGHKFDVSFLKQKDVAFNVHEVMFCADEREVVTEGLSKFLSGLPSRLPDEDEEQYVLWIYVTGKYLDDNTNPERTEFIFAPDDQRTIDDLVSKAELTGAVIQSVKGKYARLFAQVEADHQARVTNIVSEQLPHYRPLMTERYKHVVQKIPVGASEDEIEVSLHKGLRDVEVELKEAAKEIASFKPKSKAEMELLRSKYEQFLDQENLVGMSTLAKYVIHRKVILELFEKALQLGKDGKFVLEEVVHGLICPLRTDSNDMEWLQGQNLWLIDERLTHHLHLQSDKTLKSSPVVAVASTREPDVLVFEHGPHAFADVASHPGSAVLIEFKRPGADKQAKDPLEQVTDYIDRINSGSLRDKRGELIRLPNIPFTAYVICDLNEDVAGSARKYGLKESPDKKSFYGYLSNWDCYCEILSFRTVLEDAKKRNRVLFEKLNLPTGQFNVGNRVGDAIALVA